MTLRHMPLKKASSGNTIRCLAVTRTDLVMLLGGALLLFAVCLPALGTRVTARSGRVQCVNNLRQVGVAWRMSATGLNDTFPFQVPQFLPGVNFPTAARTYQW